MVEEEINPIDITSAISQKEKNMARSRTAEYLIQNYYFATMRDTEELYHYQNGYYNNGGDRYARAYIRNIWGDECTVHDITEILKAHLIPQTYTNRMEFNTNPETTCLQNGNLNLITTELTPHTPTQKYTFQLPLTWNPDAICENIDDWLTRVIRPEDIPLFWQMTGYCLWRACPIHKAFMLTGDGGNGKSTMINLLQTFLGLDNVCTKSLQELIYNRFAAAQLYGKHANLFADLSDKALNQTGPFKMLSAGDSLDGEKKFKDAFTFKNYAKLIYSANKLPEVTDTTNAFFRRWIIINFPYTFDDLSADKNMLDKLTTPEELSGMLRNAVIALQHLISEGHFMRSETTEQVEERYMKLSNSIAAFVGETVEECVDAPSISRGDLYNVYSNYCRKNNLIVKSQSIFSKSLREYVSVEEARVGNTRGWRGIKVKEGVYGGLYDEK